MKILEIFSSVVYHHVMFRLVHILQCMRCMHTVGQSLFFTNDKLILPSQTSNRCKEMTPRWRKECDRELSTSSATADSACCDGDCGDNWGRSRIGMVANLPVMYQVQRFLKFCCVFLPSPRVNFIRLSPRIEGTEKTNTIEPGNNLHFRVRGRSDLS